ncbi:MAG TPA: amino acid ABC transporter substrate-binding protein [Candidatus Enterenecus merdae]|nr:amino acid ABC transporter substrate-binding protein [Candidatus Enterenecus merdae]
MKTRKNLLALLLALAMTFALAACGGDSQNSPSPDPTGSASLDPEPTGSGSTGDYGQFTTLEEGKLIMVTNASFPPYEMTDDNNNVIGIDPEIAQAIADKLGLELVIDNIDFDAALLAVQENRADVMLAGLTYREDRDLVMDFTDSYATGVQVIIVREGDTTIQGTNEDLQLVGADGAVLEDIQIGVQRGTTGETYCQDAHGTDHVTSLDNGSLAVQALLNGQVDCVVIDDGPAREYVAANPGLEILEGSYVTEDYCAAVDEGNTALLNAVNTALNELIEDGTVQSIMDKYITAE